MLAECVLNISEGRREPVIDDLGDAAGEALLDVHSDATHNRSVLTLGGPLEAVEAAARRVVDVAVARIDVNRHEGVHPRFGSADVVPFADPVADWGASPAAALVAARDRLARWAGTELALPCFLYGPDRSLPDIRRDAFRVLAPDTGPATPHPTAGACAVGARPVLVAYNLWLAGPNPEAGDGAGAVDVARELAGHLRGPEVRTLGLAVPGGAQVSCNVLGPDAPSLADLHDAVATGAGTRGYRVARAELVGLVPDRVLRQVPQRRWAELDLAEDRTIEARLAVRGHPAPEPG